MDSQRQNVSSKAICQNEDFLFKNKPVRAPSKRMEVTDTFKAELQRRVGNEANSREFVLPVKTSKNSII